MANTNNRHGFSKLQVLEMYKECLRNHAAAAGVRSLDGCRLFEASGPIGDPAAMVCAACHCHRNFHRRIQIDLPLRDQTQAVDNVVSGQQHPPMPIPAPVPVPQPQVHQQPAPRSHARPSVPGPEITDLPPRPQVHRQASTGLAPSAAPNPAVRRQEMNQPQSGLLRYSSIRLSDVAAEERIMEGGPSRPRKRLTREQSDRLRVIAERNNWKMFREYSKEEVVGICSSIGIKRTCLKSWISNQRRKRAESNAASN